MLDLPEGAVAIGFLDDYSLWRGFDRYMEFFALLRETRSAKPYA